jgi:hypothetical protein
VHALINKQAAEFLEQNELKPNFKSIQYRVNKFLADFDSFQNCLSIAVEHHIKLYKAIKIFKKRCRKKFSKTTLYAFQRRFIKNYIYTYTRIFPLDKSLDHARTPINKHYVYNNYQRYEIAKIWHERKPLEKIFNLSDYLFKIRTKQIQLVSFKNDEQTKLSFRSMKSMINDYYHYIPKPRPYNKHALIKYLPALGHIQFDIKIIGARDNKFHLNIYCIDMVDERSGITYGRAYLTHPKHKLMETLKSGCEFYSQYFTITRIRTDHALEFKRTEALRTGEFNDYLTSLNINHQYSFWNQPQTNGKIERLHKQIDDELLPLINRCNTIQEALDLINR